MIDKIDEIECEIIRTKETIEQNIIDELNSLKIEALSNYDEERANYIWLLLTIIAIKNNFIRAYHFIKSDKYKNAWDNYANIEIMLVAVRRNFSGNFKKMKLDFIEEKTKLFQKLFPYQYFASREAIKVVEYCSICGRQIISPRNACIHVPGRIYFGEMASRIVTELKLIAIALVRNPVDKYAVIFPNGLEYNYEEVSIVVNNLQSPFDDWDLKVTKKKSSIYYGIGRNDICPCDSGKKYKHCCQGTDKELFDFHQITISKNLYRIRPFTVNVCTWK